MQRIFIIGLGNAPKEYRSTRHNVGFIFVESLAKILDTPWEKKKLAWTSEFTYKETLFSLIKLNNYINLSGEMLLKYFKHQAPDPNQIWLASDNIDLEFGKIKLSNQSSGGGHNGLRSINRHFSDQCHHIRIGVREEIEIANIKSYVLGNLNAPLSLDEGQLFSILDELIVRNSQKK